MPATPPPAIEVIPHHQAGIPSQFCPWDCWQASRTHAAVTFLGACRTSRDEPV